MPLGLLKKNVLNYKSKGQGKGLRKNTQLYISHERDAGY